MADIAFTCPECNESLFVPDSYAGQEGVCPHCGKEIVIPSDSKAIPHHSKPGECPFCGEQIAASALRCKHCGKSLVGGANHKTAGTIPSSSCRSGKKDAQLEQEPAEPGSVALGCLTIAVLVGLAVWFFLSVLGNTVYVTKSGKTYHLYRNCMNLSRSKSVETANDKICRIRGMRECKLCRKTLIRALTYQDTGSSDGEYSEDMMDDAKMHILVQIDQLGNYKYGPEQRKEFGDNEGGDAWCALGAGYNIELDRRGMLVDIWDNEGRHYDELGYEYPFTFRREWRGSWPNEPDANVSKREMENASAEAQYIYAARYLYGDGVMKSYVETVKWLRKAAEQGLAEAQYNLGIMYSNGAGVEQDYEEAMKWYRKAAEQGLAPAQEAVKALDKAMKKKKRKR